MMKLSTKCRYGLRSLLDLAIHAQDGHVALYQIAERQGLSLKYLEQDFATLRKAGFVRSIKGAQGGYMLARDPDQIRVGAVIRALEGDMLLIDPGNDIGEQTAIRRCLNQEVWQPLSERIQASMNQLTLADLVHQYEDNQTGEPMYYI
jgi:Rrf2 family cysteine metabolism transcriptional repressor